ncbi:carbohydrate sulfotransferase 15-like isoform X3 [Littorina saxatilis]|uniref:carbohydrate sulfotransferase 15-like isoform X3 n=1 Tax=Littorina saxatilis TaxID=31220 RepID=UPI0038B4F25E
MATALATSMSGSIWTMALLNLIRLKLMQAVGVVVVGIALLGLLILIFQTPSQLLRASSSDSLHKAVGDPPPMAATLPPDLASDLFVDVDDGSAGNMLSYRNSSSFLTSIFLGKSRAVCVGSNETLGEVEDLLCLPKPSYDPRLKNPCWWENITQTSNAKVPAPPASVSSLSCLPYFHILCCSKSGTTDMYRRISMHPDLVPNFGSFGKERLWWSWYKYGYIGRRTKSTPKPFDSYIRGFRVLALYLEKAQAEKRQKELKRLITLDGSPLDMWDLRGWTQLPQNRNLRQPAVLTPHLMRHLYRDPKFLILARDPVERLYTAYLFHGMGNSAQEFHEDVEEGIAMFSDCLASAQDRIECFVNASVLESMPVDLHFSCYAVYFEEWLKVFPKKHFLFLRTEDYSNDMRNSLYKIFDFLEMSRPSSQDMKKMLSAPISYHTQRKDVAGPMLNETRAMLREWFKPWNQELAHLMKNKAYLWKDADIDT